MTVEDLKIGSPVYRANLDAIEIAKVKYLELKDGGIRVGLDDYLIGVFPINETVLKFNEYSREWYIDLEVAKTAQSMVRFEHILRLYEKMTNAQSAFVEAYKKYAFMEPSEPK